MPGLDPNAIRDVMNDARKESKDPAEGFVLGISIVLGAGVGIGILNFLFFGEELFIKSIWTYLTGTAVVYGLCFLILLTFFACETKRSAKLAVMPALATQWPLVLVLAVILFIVFLVMCYSILIVGMIVLKISGKNSWGTGSLVDIFTVKWWKSKGWRPPPPKASAQ